MKRYKIFGCPKCGCVQTTESKNRLKCTRCGKSSQFMNSKGEMVLKLLGDYDNPHIAAGVCTKIKLEIESNGKVKYKSSL